MERRRRWTGTFCAVSRRRQASFGLIAVLLLLALVTALVTTLLFLVSNERTANSDYAEETQADDIAQAGVQAMIGDVRSEMEAGSTVITDANGGQEWLPTAPQTMKLVAISNAPSAVNHLRPSVPFDPATFFPAPNYNGALPFSRASASCTTNICQNGTSIPYPAFWDRVYLYDTNMDLATKPAPPDWIYIQRSGVSTNGLTWSSALKNPASSNSSYVLGRYAYQLYDVGGLLDLNAAGGPTSPSAADVRALEGTLAGIDLTQFPGFTQQAVTDLINFRNAAASSEAAYVNSITNAATATNGYMTTATGNNRFLSRGDLIRFAENEGFTQSLPYLTHFSRDLNSPGWEPRYDGPAGYQYMTMATNTTSTNRFIPNVTSAGETETNYDMAGNDDNTTLAPGQARVVKRFPLARIDWLRQVQAGSATLAQPVLSAFGLNWNPTTGRWVYSVSGSTTTADTTIRTLDQIPAGQAPNFFELLKAGILTGSLGWARDPNVDLQLQTYSNTPGNQLTTAGPYLQDPSVDYHVMKIGACIIDQFTSSATPTSIDFDYVSAQNSNNPNPSPSLDTGDWNTYYRVPATGIKDLPYIYTLGQFATLSQDADQTDMTQNGWVTFELWNPHQQNPNTTAVLTGVQISSGGPRVVNPSLDSVGNGGPVYTGGFSTSVTPSDGGTSDLYPSAPGVGPWGNTIPFALGALNNYRNPLTFRSADAAGQGTEPNGVLKYANGAVVSPGLVGFYAGTSTVPNSPTGSLSLYYIDYGQVNSPDIDPDGVPFQLQTQSGSIWNPYQVVTPHPFSGRDQGLVESWKSYNPINTPLSPFVQNQNGGVYYNSRALMAVDPRTTRGQWVDSPGSQDQNGSYQPNYLYGDGIYSTYYPGNEAVNGIVVASDADGFVRTNDFQNVVFAKNQGPAIVDRPFIISRPFHTPADMGYAFRDQPWKSVNFSATNSADEGLLDIFSVYDDPPITAGHVNLNSVSGPVVQAIISGSTKNEIQASSFSTSEAQTIANAYTNFIATTPMYSRGELANFVAENPYTDPSITSPAFTPKAETEGAIRALSGVGQTRTIVLLLDIVAQAGQYGPAANSLDNFHVSAQVHYWAHIAIDRYTGQLVDLQIEPVYE